MFEIRLGGSSCVHHSTIVVGGVIILHMAFMFLQQPDLVTLGDLLLIQK